MAGRSVIEVLPVMLCSTALQSLDADPAGWLWQVKLDGFRAQLRVGGGRGPALWSRQGNRLDGSFPDVMEAALAVLGEREVVLDCELVVVDDQARPDFAALSARSTSRTPAAVRRAAAAVPATLVAFDVLVLDGQDLRDRPLAVRFDLLTELGLSEVLSPGLSALCMLPVHEDGPGLIRATWELGLEGVVAKWRASPYVAGRSRWWVKVKHDHARDLQPSSWRR